MGVGIVEIEGAARASAPDKATSASARATRTARRPGLVNRLSVIVTTYSRPDALGLVLRALLGQTERPFEIVVADDGSAADTEAVVARWRAVAEMPIRHVWQPHGGFRAAEARNRALREVSGDYVAFLDGDCIPRPSFLARHRALAERGCFVAGDRLLLSPALTARVLGGTDRVERYSALRWASERLSGGANRLSPMLDLPDGPWRLARAQDWRGARTCNLAAFVEDLNRVDGFDGAYRGWGLEDSDLVVRLIRAGVRRKDGRFATGVLHLWHQPGDRSGYPENESRLSAVMASQRILAIHGLSKLDEEAEPDGRRAEATVPMSADLG